MRSGKDSVINRNIGRVALAVVLAVAASMFVFGSTFGAVDFYWIHFHVKPGQVSSADGVAVIGLGLILGSVLGIAAALIVLIRLWPKSPNPPVI